MRFSAITILSILIAQVCYATDPPKPPAPPSIVELTPQPPQDVKPLDPIPLATERFRWFTVSGFSGPVTFEIEGDNAPLALVQIDAPKTLFLFPHGAKAPVEQTIPAGSALVYGKLDDSGNALTGTAKVTARGFDSTTNKIRILDSKTFIVNAKPKPKPDPKPDGNDDVKPIPKPDPKPVVKNLQLVVVFDPKSITVATAAVLNEHGFWNAQKYRFVSKNATDAADMKFISEAGSSSLPRLLVRDADSDKLLTAVALPATTDEIKTLVNSYQGK